MYRVSRKLRLKNKTAQILAEYLVDFRREYCFFGYTSGIEKLASISLVEKGPNGGFKVNISVILTFSFNNWNKMAILSCDTRACDLTKWLLNSFAPIILAP